MGPSQLSLQAIASVIWMDGNSLDVGDFYQILRWQIYVQTQIAWHCLAGATWNSKDAVGDEIFPGKDAYSRVRMADTHPKKIPVMQQKDLPRREIFRYYCLQAH